ncbi:sensor histidine kinase [Nitrosococcus watsonii]|uniref:Sensor protein FixL n=1 Tax=Nitrosococcus watsoni (strain C-113) TaxID=105559 RepID=D8KBM9_NITWC|nr:PAS domain S-box protein [Nitrosococcus watsonii]ADJ27640.1 PAS/PAC sensor signal transduction histidine kinase [Nitrosococcus watsonii C-113]
MLSRLLRVESFKHLLESASNALLISDHQGQIVFSNTALEKCFGYTGKELLGLTIEDLIPKRFRQQHKTYHADYIASPHLHGTHQELNDALKPLGLHKNGTEFPLEISLIPLETSTGLYVLSIVRDTTPQRPAEETPSQYEALAWESKARLQAILNTATDGIIIIDENGLIETFNPGAERLFGYEAAEAIGQNILILMPSPHREQDTGYIERYLQTGQGEFIGASRETTGMRKNGSTFPIDISISEMRLGERRLFTGIVRDITERHHFKELEEKNAELERFIYTVSHDLRSPLITIHGFAGMLKQSFTQHNQEQILEDIGRIQAAAAKMQLLLDDLLELSRIGRLPNRPEKFSLSDLTREATELVQSAITKRGVQIKVAPTLPHLFGDRRRLLEVMQNLIENAVKFMGDQKAPWIEINAYEEEGKLLCYVRDNGMGIDPRYHEKIFNLFDSLHQNVEGTGIGLTIVKRIIEIHEGHVWVQSAGAIGQGSTFYFSLPRAPD